MPGLTLWINSTVSEPEFNLRYSRAQQAMIFAPDYQAKMEFTKQGCCLGHVNYPEYPIKLVHTDDYMIYFEGRIYNKSWENFRVELNQIAQKIFSTQVNPQTALEQCICQTEGEYVVVIASSQTCDLLIFTDPFGRLPLYYYKDDANLILARESKFVEHIHGNTTFDRIGCAQFLWVGYPLGRRTLIQEVNRSPGGMMLRTRLDGKSVYTQISSLFTFNFDNKDTSGQSIEAYASELAETFTEVCREWGSHPEVSQNILSLSGGQDSRTVAGGMIRAGTPFVAETFTDAAGNYVKKDACIARELARELKLQWHLFELAQPTQSDIDRLIHMKDGLNYAGMAYIIPFMEYLMKKFGRSATYITGDGGDKVLPDLRDPGKVANINQLVQRIVRRHSSMPIELAESIFKLDAGTLTEELRAILADYPEQNLVEKEIHYAIYERGRKWLYEGEDRSRFFLWQTSPFYSFRFFRKAMRVPNDLKKLNRLYAKFQSLLCPKCCEIPNADSGLLVNSMFFKLRLKLGVWARNLPLPLKQIARRFGGHPLEKVTPLPENMTLLNTLLKESSGFGELVSPPAVDNFLDNCNRFQFDNFWTLVMLAKLRHYGFNGKIQ